MSSTRTTLNGAPLKIRLVHQGTKTTFKALRTRLRSCEANLVATWMDGDRPVVKILNAPSDFAEVRREAGVTIVRFFATTAERPSRMYYRYNCLEVLGPDSVGADFDDSLDYPHLMWAVDHVVTVRQPTNRPRRRRQREMAHP